MVFPVLYRWPQPVPIFLLVSGIHIEITRAGLRAGMDLVLNRHAILTEED